MLRKSSQILFRTNNELSHRFMATIAMSGYGNPTKVLSVTKGSAAPEPQNNEIKVSIKASTVTTEDIQTIKGYSIVNNLKGVAGTIASGTVVSTGSGVTGFSKNDTVLVVNEGVWTDEAVVPAAGAAKVPNLSVEEVAALPPYLSAWAILNNHASSLNKDDIVVQSNASTAVGSAITEVGKAMGIKVVSLTDADVKDAKLASKLKSNGTIKMAISGQSGQHINNMIRALAPDGCLVTYNGVAESFAEPIDISTSNTVFKNISLYGHDLKTWVHNNKDINTCVTELLQLLTNNNIKIKLNTVSQNDYGKAIEMITKDGSIAVLKH